MASTSTTLPSGSVGIVDHTNVVDSTVEAVPADSLSIASIESLDVPSEHQISQKSALARTKKTSLTILLIGETGCGKTTFMSLLLNLLHGNGYDELKEYNDKKLESGLSETESQTTRAKLYTIFAQGTKIQILDTPGLADTRGIEQDNMNKAEINRAIQEFVTTLDAVMILTNGTAERLSVATDYTLNIISTMFPHSIGENIGFILTNSDPLTCNFKFDGLQPELQSSPFWKIQNPLAMHKNYQKQEAELKDKPKQRLKIQIQNSYDDAVDTLNEWLRWLDERTACPTTEIDRLYNIAVNIESNLEAAIYSITQLAKQQTAYEKFSKDLQDVKSAHYFITQHAWSLIIGTESKAAFQALKNEQTSSVWCREPTDDYNTICVYPDCHSNCHSPCQMKVTDDPKRMGTWCEVFRTLRYIPSFWSGASTKCGKCKHSAKHHGYYPSKHVLKAQSDPKATEQLENAANDQQRLEAAMAVAKDKLESIKEERNSGQKAISTLVDEFNSIALNKSYIGHINSTIDILKLRKEGIKNNPSASEELNIINLSIEKLQQKRRLLAEPSSRWKKTKAVARTAVRSAASKANKLRA